jgi:6-phosphogluconolactonase (cycloisomerase 2 family)
VKSETVLVRKLAVGGIVSLVLLAGCGGGTSPSSSGSNPTPTITTISPNSSVAGSAAFTLTINGTNFVAGSMVNFGGSAPATTFVNSTQLTAAIPAASIASTGTPAVTVTNPAPGAGTSKAINFTITSGLSSVPTISVLDPSSIPAGEQSFQLQVAGPYPGSNFVTGSVVRWNGSDRPTMSNGSINGLIAQISASDVAAAGTAAVTVFNPGPGGGSSNALTFTITTGAVDPQSIAVDPAGKFAYVMDGGSDGNGGYVSMYMINPTTGALASIGPPVSTYGYGVYYGSGVNAGSVAVDPFGKFAYVTNSGDVYDYGDGADGSVAMYAINATTGALTSAGTINGNCPGLCLPSSMVVDPSGRLAYVANGGGGVPYNVAMYTINSTTGALTSIGTIAAGTDPISVAVDPAGKFAYVANWTGYDTDGSVSMYTIDATTGGLTPIGTIATGLSPTSIAIHPSAKFAYVTNSGSNSVSMYSIDSATGTLTLIGTIGT